MRRTAKYTIYNPESHMTLPVIFFIHGTPGSSSHADIYCSDFIEKGHTIVAWGRPGYGTTVDSRDMTFAEQAAEAIRLLDDLGAMHDIILYGVGSGAGIALEVCCAALDRFSGVILESPIFSTYRHTELNSYQRFLDYVIFSKVGHVVFEGICKISPLTASILLLYRYSTLNRRQILAEARAACSHGLTIRRLKMLLASTREVIGGSKGYSNDLVELTIDRSDLISYLPDRVLVLHGDSDIESSLMESDKIMATKTSATRVVISGGSHMLPISSRLVYVGFKKTEFVGNGMT